MAPAGCLDTIKGIFSSNNSANVITTTSSGIKAPLAIVDMGSNGIRFGIIASLDRHLPVLYEERASISLFAAQFSDADGGKGGEATATPVAPKGSSSKASDPPLSNSTTLAVLLAPEDEERDVAEDDDMIDDSRAKVDPRKTLVASGSDHVPVKVPGGGVLNLPVLSERQPISEKVIDEVVRTFERWAALCQTAGVQKVRVIATEATRTAPNSDEFQARIKAATGWTVELLTKAQEANIGALGVMASYHKIQGLFMDLGGGSVQLNYIDRDPQKDSQGKSSPNAQSWPYGAAALSRRLNGCGSDQDERKKIYKEMVDHFRAGLHDINIPADIRDQNQRLGGYRLYLSGGGFRALGYLLMAKKMKGEGKESKTDEGCRYPIPIINGFVATGEELSKVVHEYRFLAPEDVNTCFRVSKRRAKLIPACATLMAAVMEVIPIKEVLFSEGGVRQGGCFNMLAPAIQGKDPAIESVKSFVNGLGGGQPPLTDLDVEALTAFVLSAIPEDFAECCRIAAASVAASSSGDPHGGLSPKDAAELELFINSIPRLVNILVMVMNCYNQLPKEARSTAAWQLFLPGGSLANCYGLTHSDRAILATALAERHEGDLADPETADAVKKLIPGGKVARQAVRYLGRILGLAGLFSPLPGLATLLLSTAGLPNKERGHISFVHKPHPSRKDGNGKKKHRHRDHDRTRVGDGHSSSSSSSSSDESDNERERGGRHKDEHRVVILKAGTLPSGAVAHGRVVVRVRKGHPLLVSPNVLEALEDLAKAATKTHGFTGTLSEESGKGKKK
ncbi:hypothetical protein BGX34_006119 [Mortierella sp. NVP85]|nr:hypothetical protein BGX34_006119 [Mortierella sp. NVP85]